LPSWEENQKVRAELIFQGDLIASGNQEFIAARAA
jgi:hypothetical protein